MIEACYEPNVFNLTHSHVWSARSSWSHYSNILVVNIQIFQVVKNSNISGCQKLKYFWLSKIRIFLVVKIENTIYIFQVSCYLRPLSVKPLRQESVPYFLSSCSEAWTDQGEALLYTEYTTCHSTLLLVVTQKRNFFLFLLAVQDSSISDIVCALEPTNNQSLGSIKEWP